MLEAELHQGSLLKKILESIKELVSNANIDATKKGLSIEAMDTSHVSLVHLSMNADCFDYFSCDRDIALGINMENISKVLRCANANDSIALKAEDDDDALQLTFKSKDLDRESHFKLKLVNIEADQMSIPDNEYEANVKMSSVEFKKICSDLTNMGDAVTLSATKKGLQFQVSGSIGEGEVFIKPTGAVDKESVELNVTEPVCQTFALKYLNQFCKSTQLTDHVYLHLSETAPFMVEYRFSDAGSIRYYLAPKMDEDDDDDE